MVEVLSYSDAMRSIARANNKYLLLGNGFSIALKPDIFTYGSLYENADFSAAPYLPQIFDALGTRDFEVIIRHLSDTAQIIEVYRPKLRTLAARLRRDAEVVKDILVEVIASRHPSRPYEISNDQYRSCRSFLRPFRSIFTLNYDVLLYWALMQNELGDGRFDHDDGFRHPVDNEDAPYVSWQQGSSATVSYLHGALHVFDRGTEITKYTWSKTDMPIVEQVRDALNDNKFPVFVAEGSTDMKVERILHNAYLHKALRSFEGSMKAATGALVVFGHSLAPNDDHILRCIAAGGVSNLLVGLYGPPDTPANRVAIRHAQALTALRKRLRGDRWPLALKFYDAASAHVWDAP
ncbi:DUF4917 family protein [Rhizobium leguminosarum]